MMKKWIALLLAMCMVMSLAACSSGTAENEKPDGTTSSENGALDKITVWTDAFASSDESVKAVCDQFLADTGVELDWVSFPKEDYENVVMASLMSCDEEDLPDIIFNAPLGTMLRQEMLYDMAPLFENNEKMADLVKNQPSLIASGKAGNSVYSIASQAAQAMVFWIREDIVNELNLKQPTNLDEFTDMLRTIKNAHPEMITLTGPAKIDYWDAASGWFGVKNKVVQTADGKFVDNTLSPEYKEYMDYMKMLYAEGILDKELPTNNSMSDVRTKFFSGKAAVTLMWDNLYRLFEQGLEDNGIDARPTYLQPIDGDKGSLGLMYNPAQNMYCMTVGVGSDERAQQVFDTFFTWMYTTDAGISINGLGPKGVVWDTDENGFNVGGVLDPGVKPLDWHVALQGGWELPYKLTDREARNEECINDIRAEMSKRVGTVQEEIPGPAYLDYYGIVEDLMSKRTELFHLYITGQSDYNSFCTDYQAYCNEQGLQGMLDEMNAQ